MDTREVGDWLLWRAKVAPRRNFWIEHSDNLWSMGLKGEFGQPDGWVPGAWLIKTAREWRLQAGWQVRVGWLPLEGGLACPHRMAGKALWHPRWTGVRGALKRSARLLTYWQGLPATLPDACYAASLGVEAWSRCGVKQRVTRGLLEDWINKRPLDVRGGTMLGVLECILNDGMATAGSLTTQWEFRLARLAAMERAWGERWRVPRVIKEIKEA